jgi:hypothetical protein
VSESVEGLAAAAAEAKMLYEDNISRVYAFNRQIKPPVYEYYVKPTRKY